MATLEILNPVAEIMPMVVPAAPRLESLDGKTIGLFWNMKAGGDVALAAVSEELAKRHPGIKFRSYTGSVGSLVRLATPADQTRMAAECDAVVGTTAD